MSIGFPGSAYPYLSTFTIFAAPGITIASGTTTVSNGYWGNLYGSITGTLVGAGSPQGLNTNLSEKSGANNELNTLANILDNLMYSLLSGPSGPGQTLTLQPGCYTSSAITFPLNTTLVFDGANQLFPPLFVLNGTTYSPQAIDLSNVIAINLINGATASNIFWYSKLGGITCTSSVLSGIPGTMIVMGSQNINISGVPLINGRIFNAGSVVTLTDVANVNATSGIPCYFKGTQILTDNGCVAVETLKVGDKVQTFADVDSEFKVTVREPTLQSVVSVETFTVEDPSLANGLICLSTGCLGNGLPVHNLYVSPDHGIHVNGYLVPAKTLVNGASIFHERTPQKLDYYHVEMESHVCIEANGALAESRKKE